MSLPPSSGAVVLEVQGIPLGAIGTNCWIINAAGDTRAVIVDPGGEPEKVMALLDERGLSAAGILVTHGHWDHLGGIAGLARDLELDVWMSGVERDRLEKLEEYGPESFGPWESWHVDHVLEGGERIELAGITFDVMLVPGHSPAHLAYLVAGVADASGDGWEMPPMLFSGDVLFEGSVGRTDLPGADHATLVATIERLYRSLDDETVVLPGHMGVTTIGRERTTNPFVQG